MHWREDVASLTLRYADLDFMEVEVPCEKTVQPGHKVLCGKDGGYHLRLTKTPSPFLAHFDTVCIMQEIGEFGAVCLKDAAAAIVGKSARKRAGSPMWIPFDTKRM